MDVLVSLKHDGKLSDYVNKAYAAKHLCDVKVVTGDQSTFYTHRLVLSAFSEFFQRKISGQQESHNMVIPIGEDLFAGKGGMGPGPFCNYTVSNGIRGPCRLLCLLRQRASITMELIC